MTRTHALILAALWMAVPKGTAVGNDIGRWRMPSTVAQAAGMGYGPGHHAPIVRAPGYRTPPAPRIVVVPRTEQPFCPQAYREIRGCGSYGCGVHGCATGGCVAGSYGMSAPLAPSAAAGPYMAPPATTAPAGMAPTQWGYGVEVAPPPAAGRVPAQPPGLQPTPAQPQPQPPAARPPMPPVEPLPSPQDRQAMFFGW